MGIGRFSTSALAALRDCQWHPTEGNADCATPPLHGTTAAAEMVARQAAANGDELLNLTMAVNGKGVHKMETHKAIYEELAQATDAANLRERLIDIGQKVAQDGTYLDPF